MSMANAGLPSRSWMTQSARHEPSRAITSVCASNPTSFAARQAAAFKRSCSVLWSAHRHMLSGSGRCAKNLKPRCAAFCGIFVALRCRSTVVRPMILAPNHESSHPGPACCARLRPHVVVGLPCLDPGFGGCPHLAARHYEVRPPQRGRPCTARPNAGLSVPVRPIRFCFSDNSLCRLFVTIRGWPARPRRPLPTHCGPKLTLGRDGRIPARTSNRAILPFNGVPPLLS